MAILLVHALRSEAGLIRQHFPQARRPECSIGLELRELVPGVALLRTGMGLTRTQAALHEIPDPESYDLILHFGVSGALNPEIPLRTLVHGSHFLSPEARSVVPPLAALPDVVLTAARFISVDHPVTDDAERESLFRLGADVVDMESFAVATFCTQQNISYLPIRCISDLAGNSAEAEFKANYTQASEKLQLSILKVLKESA